MKPMNDRTQSRQTRPALSPSPKRFRIDKLEERIAPRSFGHQNPHTKVVGSGGACTRLCD